MKISVKAKNTEPEIKEDKNKIEKVLTESDSKVLEYRIDIKQPEQKESSKPVV